jgi:hypothetical protein
LRFDHLEVSSLQFDHLETLPLRFNHSVASSFGVRSFRGVAFAVQSWQRHWLCSSTLQFDHVEALSVCFDIHHHCHNHCTMINRWLDAPSIHVGREVISILTVELERKTRKKN